MAENKVTDAPAEMNRVRGISKRRRPEGEVAANMGFLASPLLGHNREVFRWSKNCGFLRDA